MESTTTDQNKPWLLVTVLISIVAVGFSVIVLIWHQYEKGNICVGRRDMSDDRDIKDDNELNEKSQMISPLDVNNVKHGGSPYDHHHHHGATHQSSPLHNDSHVESVVPLSPSAIDASGDEHQHTMNNNNRLTSEASGNATLLWDHHHVESTQQKKNEGNISSSPLSTPAEEKTPTEIATHDDDNKDMKSAAFTATTPFICGKSLRDLFGYVVSNWLVRLKGVKQHITALGIGILIAILIALVFSAASYANTFIEMPKYYLVLREYSSIEDCVNATTEGEESSAAEVFLGDNLEQIIRVPADGECHRVETAGKETNVPETTNDVNHSSSPLYLFVRAECEEKDGLTRVRIHGGISVEACSVVSDGGGSTMFKTVQSFYNRHQPSAENTTTAEDVCNSRESIFSSPSQSSSSSLLQHYISLKCVARDESFAHMRAAVATNIINGNIAPFALQKMAAFSISPREPDPKTVFDADDSKDTFLIGGGSASSSATVYSESRVRVDDRDDVSGRVFAAVSVDSSTALLEHSSIAEFVFVGPNGEVEPPAVLNSDQGSNVANRTFAFKGNGDHLQYLGIAGTMHFDLSDFTDFSITAWVKLNNDSKGFVFAVTDNYEGNDGSSSSQNSSSSNLILKRVISALNNGDVRYYGEQWRMYSGLYADGAGKTLRFVHAEPFESGIAMKEEGGTRFKAKAKDAISGSSSLDGAKEADDAGGEFKAQVEEGVTDVTWPSTIAATLFDNQWHFIGITIVSENGQRRAQLFIDAKTSYHDQEWSACLPKDGFRAITKTLSPSSPAYAAGGIQDASMSEVSVDLIKNQTAFHKGVLHVGALKGSVAVLRIHPRILEREEFVGLGAPSMKSHLDVDREVSRTIGFVLLGIAIVGLVAAIASVLLFIAPQLRDDDVSIDDLLLAANSPHGVADVAASVDVLFNAASLVPHHFREQIYSLLRSLNLRGLLGGFNNTNGSDGRRLLMNIFGGKKADGEGVTGQVGNVEFDAGQHIKNIKSVVGLDATPDATMMKTGGGGILAGLPSLNFLDFATPILAVFQGTAMYVEGWQWPSAINVNFDWLFTIFSLDLGISLPDLDLLVVPAVQVMVGVVCMCLVISFLRRDGQDFEETCRLQDPFQLPKPLTGTPLSDLIYFETFLEATPDNYALLNDPEIQRKLKELKAIVVDADEKRRKTNPNHLKVKESENSLSEGNQESATLLIPSGKNEAEMSEESDDEFNDKRILIKDKAVVEAICASIRRSLEPQRKPAFANRTISDAVPAQSVQSKLVGTTNNSNDDSKYETLVTVEKGVAFIIGGDSPVGTDSEKGGKADDVGDILGSNAAAATTAMGEMSIQKVLRKIPLTVSRPTECPLHNKHLIECLPSIHNTLRGANNCSPYACLFSNPAAEGVLNVWDAEDECVENNVCPGVVSGFFVCPTPGCSFCICPHCFVGAANKVQGSVRSQIFSVLHFGPYPLIAALVMVAAQSLYQPINKTALMIISCHSSFWCHFPSCHDPITPIYWGYILISAFVLGFIGLGFIAVMLWVLARRHRQAQVIVADAMRARNEKDSETMWRDVITGDRSLLRSLYASFTLSRMWMHPVGTAFKLALVFPVVLAPPGSLSQIVGTSVIEVLLLVMWIVFNPFSNPWIGFLTHAGSVHQIGQLCLTCFHRAAISEDPHHNTYALAMTWLLAAYLILAVVVIIVTVVIPTVKSIILPDPVEGASIKLDSCKRRAAILTLLFEAMPPPGPQYIGDAMQWAELVKSHIPATVRLASTKKAYKEKSDRATRKPPLVADFYTLSKRNFLATLPIEERVINKVIAFGGSFFAYLPSFLSDGRKKRLEVLAEVSPSLMLLEREIIEVEAFISEMWHALDDPQWCGEMLKEKRISEEMIVLKIVEEMNSFKKKMIDTAIDIKKAHPIYERIVDRGLIHTFRLVRGITRQKEDGTYVTDETQKLSPLAGTDTLVHAAALNGFLPILKSLLLCVDLTETDEANEEDAGNYISGQEKGVSPYADFVDPVTQTTPLMAACQQSHFEVAKALIDHGANVNKQPTAGGPTALLVASLNGNAQLVKLLIDSKADINRRGTEGNSPLLAAILFRNDAVVDLLLEAGADVNAVNDAGFSTVMYAANFKNVPLVMRLFQIAQERYGDDAVKHLLTGAVVANNITLLHIAAAFGLLDLVKFILAQKGPDRQPIVDPDIQYSNGGTALLLAVLKGHLEVANYLIDTCKVKVDVARDRSGFTALMAAAQLGFYEIVKKLVESGADVNANSNDKHTALICAAGKNHLDICKLLVKNGAIVNHKCDLNVTALYSACSAGHIAVIKYLIEEKNAVITIGDHPLQGAAGNGRFEAVKFLLDKGCFVDVTEEKGMTPLIVAAHAGSLEVVKLLIDRKADVNHASIDGDTALHLAVLGGHTEIVRQLIKAGANVNHKEASKGLTPLHFATNANQEEVCRILVLEGKAEVNCPSNSGSLPMFQAAKKGNLNLVNFFYEHGADINSQTPDKANTVFAAAMEGFPEVLSFLIEKGAEVETCVANDLTPLGAAVIFGRFECTEILLLTHRVNMNARRTNGSSPALEACAFPETLKLFIEHTTIGQMKIHRMRREINRRKLAKSDALNARDALSGTKVETPKSGANVTINSDAQLLSSSSALPPNTSRGDDVMCDGVHNNNHQDSDVDILPDDPLMIIDVGLKSLIGLTMIYVACNCKSLETVELVLEHVADMEQFKRDFPRLRDRKREIISRRKAAKNEMQCAGDYDIPEDPFAALTPFNVNAADNEGNTSLYLCATHQLLNVGKRILQARDIDVDFTLRTDKQTPLCCACMEGDIEFVKLLVSAGANVNHVAGYGMTPLSIAIKSGHTGIALYLVNEAKSLTLETINLKASFGVASLFFCFLSVGMEEVMAALIRRGADVTATSPNGETLLAVAVGSEKLPLVRTLILEGHVDINEPCSNGLTPLLIACTRNLTETATFLLSQPGIDVNSNHEGAMTTTKTSPLMQACENQNFDLVKLLIVAGADVNHLNALNQSALHISTAASNSEISHCLLAETSISTQTINQRDSNGMFPLLHCARSQTIGEIALLLLKKGADPNMKSPSGDSLLSEAALRGLDDVVEALLVNGGEANPDDAQSSSGVTPLIAAAHAGQTETIRILLSKAKHIDVNSVTTDLKQSALMKVAAKGMLEATQLLVEAGADVNIVDANNMSVLNTALIFGELDIAKYLLTNQHAKIDPKLMHLCGNCDGGEPISPIFNATRFAGSSEVVSLLIKNGADANIFNHTGNNPLILACVNGFLDVIRILVDEGKSDVNMKSVDGVSPILCAIIRQHASVVEYLLAKGADPCVYTPDGYTALSSACVIGNSEIVNLLISSAGKEDERGALLNQLNHESAGGTTALMEACLKGRLQIVQQLVAAGADVSIMTHANKTALICAASCGHTEVVKYLLTNTNVDVNERMRGGSADSDGVTEDGTPIVMAAVNGHLETIKVLVEVGKAEIDYACKNGCTALGIAANNGHHHVVSYLVSLGANPEITFGANKLTPIYLAASKGKIEVLISLLSSAVKKINVDTLSADKITPFVIACSNGHLEAAKVLQSYGADIWIELENGLNAFYNACRFGQTDVVKYLLGQRGVDRFINKQTSNGITPFYVCGSNSSNFETYKVLFQDRRVDKLKKCGDEGNNIALVSFIANGNFEMVKHFLENIKEEEAANLDLSEVNSLNYPPLWFAISSGRAEIVKYIIVDLPSALDQGEENKKKGAQRKENLFNIAAIKMNINKVYGRTNPHTLLMLACSKNSLDIVKILVEQAGADVNATGGDVAATPLIFACNSTSTKPIAHYLLSRGALPNTATKNGLTPAHACVTGNNLECIKLLARWPDADLTTLDRNGLSPLYTAAIQNRVRIVCVLLPYHFQKTSSQRMETEGGEGIAEIFSSATPTKTFIEVDGSNLGIQQAANAALVQAASYNSADVIRALLSSDLEGCDIGDEEEEDEFFSSVKLRPILGLSKNTYRPADINHSISPSGITALYAACFKGHTEALDALSTCAQSNQRSDCPIAALTLRINQKIASGETALFAACFAGWTQIVEKLLEYDTQMCEGLRANSVAGSNSDVNSLQLEINTLASSSNAPIRGALSNGHANIACKLVEYDPKTFLKTYDDDHSTALFFFAEFSSRPLPSTSEFPQQPNTGHDEMIFKTIQTVLQCCTDETSLENFLFTKHAAPDSATAFHVAFMEGNLNFIKAVMTFVQQRHSSPSSLLNALLICKTDQGETPFLMACIHNQAHIINFLAEECCRVSNSPSASNATALLSNREGREDVVEVHPRISIDTFNFIANEPSSPHKRSPIFSASLSDSLAVVQCLVALRTNQSDTQPSSMPSGFSINIDAVDKDGDSALDVAFRQNNVEIAKELLFNGKACRANPRFSLLAAARIGDVDLLRTLLIAVRDRIRREKSQLGSENAESDIQADEEFESDFVNFQPLAENDDGVTAIYYAAGAGHTECVRMLLHEFNADPALAAVNDTNPMFGAVANGHIETVEILLPYSYGVGAAGMSVDGEKGEGNEKATIEEAKQRTLKKLSDNYKNMANGNQRKQMHLFDINNISADGQTVLFHATMKNHVEIVKLLLSACGTEMINPNIGDVDNDVAIKNAAENENVDVFKLLLDFPTTDVNAQDRMGNNALLLAAASPSQEASQIVELLLQHPRIDVNRTNHPSFGGYTALHCASKFGCTKNISLLLSHPRVMVNARSVDIKHAETALFCAVSSGQTKAVELLVAAGADVNATCSQVQHPPLFASVGQDVEQQQQTGGDENEVNKCDDNDNNLNAKSLRFTHRIYGITPLMEATRRRHHEIAKVLLRANARLNAIAKRSPVTHANIVSKKEDVTASQLAVEDNLSDFLKLFAQSKPID